VKAADHVAGAMTAKPPRYWEDYEVGQKYPLGSTSFTEQEIVNFARQYDPQSFHVDRDAARESIFGGLIASGWHIASKMMRLFVDNYIDKRTALGSPGLDEVRWLKPVRPGDALSGWVECAAKMPSKSKLDRGVVHERWQVTNQKGELVMTAMGISLVRRRPA
jgi:acyl dehydratase